ncbi:MAG: zinc-dependent metalloprotease, partial [Acidimicrobiales bacterium]
AEIRAGKNPLKEAGVVGLVATEEQMAAIQRIQALMSLLEGHGDVTMDRAAVDEVPQAAHFASVLKERREQAKGPARLLIQILGLEAKFRQYQEGENFVRAVEKIGGRTLFDQVWQGPEWLPSLAEIRDPKSWVERISPSALAG